MKKQYSKPAIVCEDYRHNTTISTACDVKPDEVPGASPWGTVFTDDDADCDASDDFTLWVAGYNCTVNPTDMAQPGDTICYNIPTDEMPKLFNS